MPGLGVSCAEGDTIVRVTSSGWGCSSYASGGLSGPSGCANIGDECADGTVFAGYHPITQAHLFIPFFFPPQIADGSGTARQSRHVHDELEERRPGQDDISTDSTNDGQVNHANRGGAIGDFQAFQACEDLGFGGHSDWYLPLSGGGRIIYGLCMK